MFDRLLETARNGGITPAIALEILEQSRLPEKALKLFSVATQMRDEYLGRGLWWTAAIEAVLPCEIEPKCGHCNFSNDHIFDGESIVKVIGPLVSMGFKHLHLSGGAKLSGYGREIVEMVQAIQAISDIEIEVNLGPSLDRSTVRRLKELKISSITSSLECFNEEIFRQAKLGDSLKKRKELLEMCEEEGVSTRSMILIGLGESDRDRIDHLFYLKGLKQLYHLRFSRFFPFSATEYRNHPRCSPWEVARIVAVARLILPDVQLGLASGNSLDDIPLWFLAGGGNQLLGAAANMKSAPKQPGAEIFPITDDLSIVSRMKDQERFVKEMGLSVRFDCPPFKRAAPGRLKA